MAREGFNEAGNVQLGEEDSFNTPDRFTGGMNTGTVQPQAFGREAGGTEYAEYGSITEQDT